MKKISLKRMAKAVLFIALLVAVVAGNKHFAKAATNGSVKATTIITGNEEFAADSIYSGTMTSATSSSGTKTSVVAVTTDCSGILDVYYQGNNTDKVYMTLYEDEACTKSLDYGSVEVSAEMQVIEMTVPQTGTYYIQFKAYEKVDVQYKTVAAIYSSEDSILANEEVRLVSLMKYDDVNYYEITLEKAGFVKIYTANLSEETFYGDIEICKSSGGNNQVISSGSATSEGQVFGLAKGTYYIKFSHAKSGKYSMGYEFTSLADKSGTKKAKAKLISYGKTLKGLILSSEKEGKADWYKFSNSKSRKLTIYFEGEVTGSVELEFYDSKGKLFGSLRISEYTKSASGSPYVGSYGSQSGKLPKGTYYIKVIKDDEDASGYYSVKLK